MSEMIDSINNQIRDLRMENIEPKYLIVNYLIHLELSSTADIEGSLDNIDTPMFMGLIIAVVDSDHYILEVR